MLTWRLRIAVLWISMAMCQSAAVALLLFQPGAVGDLMGGHLAGEDVQAPGTQVTTVAYYLGPMVLAFLTMVLKDAANRQFNALLGGAASLSGVVGLVDSSWTVTSLGLHLVGVAVTLASLLILWHAWKWPPPGPAGQPNATQETTLP